MSTQSLSPFARRAALAAVVFSLASACGSELDAGAAGTNRAAIQEGVGGTGLELGVWKLNDCSPNSNVVLDSSGNGLHGIETAGVGCAEGVDGLGAAFDNGGEHITVANSGVMTFERDLTILAFVKPTAVGNTEQIVAQKAEANKQSFTLRIINGRVEFTVELRTGVRVTSRAPITAGRWTHVAGSYNGTSALLFLDGVQVGQTAGAGSVRNVSGPLVLGGPAKGRGAQLLGGIDEVRLINQPVSAFDIFDRSCIDRPTTLEVVASQSGPVQPDTPVNYDVVVTNGQCRASDFAFFSQFVPQGISLFGDGNFINIPARSTGTFPVTLVGSSDAEPGLHEVQFAVVDFNTFNATFGVLPIELTEPTGCHVKTSRELMIKNVSVVDDPVRAAPGGAWHFGTLMRDMAPTPEQAPAMVEDLLNRWLNDQTVNGFTMPARPFMQQLVIDAWPRTLDGELDLDQSPMTLLAIVNRMDLRNLDNGNAGEGRFVFGVAPFGSPQSFTVILEYRLPATTEADVVAWTNRWHDLGSLPFPSEEYNAALQQVTTAFAGRNAEPGRPNGNAISQVRTNEIALAGPWELREFNLSADTGFLENVSVKLTPANEFDQTQTLADFVNQNEAAILVERHDVPALFDGAPFLTGNSFNNLNPWFAPGINNNEARHKFSLNTCNGCHGSETGTGFLHVNPRFPGQEAQLSGFMTGITVFDQFTGEPRTLNDLGRRRTDLFSLVCAPPPPPGEGEGEGEGEAAPLSVTSTNLRKGIGRTH